MLSAERVRVSLGGASIFRPVSLQLAPGRILRLAGPSGAGKSTLLRALAALIPFEGEIHLDDCTPAQLGYPAWRGRVMYVPQLPVMFAGSVRDNLARPFRYRGRSASFDEARAAKLLASLDLPGLLGSERDARELSGGEQQRVQLVRALLLDPAVLLMDEPTASLGTGHVAAAEALLRQYAERGGRIILVTHDEAQAERLADTSVSITPARAKEGTAEHTSPAAANAGAVP